MAGGEDAFPSRESELRPMEMERFSEGKNEQTPLSLHMFPFVFRRDKKNRWFIVKAGRFIS